MPIILATQEAEIWRILFQRQTRKVVARSSLEKHVTIKRISGVAKDVLPELEARYDKKKSVD
jgi:hypothetical protein